MSSQLLIERYQALDSINIGDSYLQLAEIKQAEENFARAFQIAQTFQDDPPKPLPQASGSSREGVLKAFLRCYAKVENYESAVRVARGIDREDFQACVLSAIASQIAATGRPELALNIVKTIESNYYKTLAFIDIYCSYNKAEQTSNAAEILTQIVRIARDIKNNLDPAWMLTHLSYYVQQKLGQLDTAFEIAQLVEQDSDKAQVLSMLGRKYAEAGQFDRALQIAEIIDIKEKEFVLAVIGKEYAKAGRTDEALKIAAILDKWKNLPLIQVVKSYAKTGEFERAKQLTETLSYSEDNDDRYEAFNGIVEGYVKSGEFDTAVQFAGSLDDKFNKTEVLSSIAYYCADMGQFDRAFQAIQTMYEINDGSICDIFLECISDFVAEAEKREEVLKIIQTTENEAYRNYMLGWIACDYANAGEFNRAITITKMITDESYSSYALSWEVESAIASKQFDRAVRVAQTIHDMSYGQSIKLGKNVISVAKAGQLDQAFQIAQTIKDRQEKAQALANIALSCAASAQQEKASELLTEAVAVAHSLENVYLKIRSLETIATNLSRAGQLSKAVEILSEVLEIVSTIEDVHQLSLQGELNSKLRRWRNSQLRGE